MKWHTLEIWSVLLQCLRVALRKWQMLLKCSPPQLAHGLKTSWGFVSLVLAVCWLLGMFLELPAHGCFLVAATVPTSGSWSLLARFSDSCLVTLKARANSNNSSSAFLWSGDNDYWNEHSPHSLITNLSWMFSATWASVHSQVAARWHSLAM